MGWGRTLLLGDIGNRLDIADTEQHIRDLRGMLRTKSLLDRTQDKRLAELESENEQLKLYLASLIGCSWARAPCPATKSRASWRSSTPTRRRRAGWTLSAMAAGWMACPVTSA
ncbi:MAG: hypothetical protein ACYTG2_10545 [Planctomycetota bacterium]|jgi:hypothetical protein